MLRQMSATRARAPRRVSRLSCTISSPFILAPRPFFIIIITHWQRFFSWQTTSLIFFTMT